MSRPGDGRGRTSYSASLASSALMVGEPLAAEWLETIRWVFYQRVLRSGFVDPARVVVWGDSLACPNPPEANIVIPHDGPKPWLAEPLAATFASVLALDRPSLKPKAVIARGGLVSYHSVLDSPFVHVPHDVLPVNIFRAGDLPDVWAQLAPQPLRLEGLIDGTNRRVTGEKLKKALHHVMEVYKKGGLVVKEEYTPDAELAKWIVDQLKK